ncbi:hypothetical protein Q4598_17620 [Phaeobacter inhibens]|uniref:hypothetical protein n=1 Tax=Phaeobacter inhibens TaxID=221822 RepID=UPI0026E2CA45|nr:hypothetical protein [Phaeobacter inhibens]MDO6758061.1 hypothetical protein [Phaeobacter inhibens]
MPLRKSKVEYAELRARATGSRGHLGGNGEVPADAETKSASDAVASPAKDETAAVKPQKQEAAKSAPPPKKPALKPAAPETPEAAKAKSPAKDAGTEQKSVVRSKPSSKPSEGHYVRIIMHPIAAGICGEYDEIADAMDIATANKVILSRAIEAVTDVSQLHIDPKSKPYGRREGQRLETKRSLDVELSAAVKAAYDPLNIMTEHTLALKTAECLIANYIRIKG